MKILFCTPQPISHYLGISRVLIELKKELELSGHNVELIGPLEMGLANTNFASLEFRKVYTRTLKNYLIKNAHLYDVVDYDHEFLPFDRSLFAAKTLFVARTVLLVQHIKFIKPKKNFSFRSFVGEKLRHGHFKKRLFDSWKTLVNADLINVPNHHDAKRLIELGINKDKIVTIPFGLSTDRIAHFNNLKACTPATPKVCFLGSFDYRKGASHFGTTFNKIKKMNPETKLLLLGCGGLFSSRESVLKFFNKADHDSIETVFKFEREKIADYLSDCSLGIYPSYFEGFPFGILEMLLAYLPVVAFDAPGASMMLSAEDLVPVGDENKLSQWVIELLNNSKKLAYKREQAHHLALKFTWTDIAQKTVAAYSR